MKAGRAVVVDSILWAVWGSVVGGIVILVPDARLAGDGFVTRIRPWEQDGRRWESLGVRRWKDRLPEIGPRFGAPVTGDLARPDAVALDRLARQTRRAELVHWVVPLAAAVMPLWSPAPVSAVMAAYAVCANAPCVVVQRYNRARVERIVARRRTAERS